MRRMSDTELLLVLPQLLGISFAMVLLGILYTNEKCIYAALAVLFLLILRSHVLYILGTTLHTTIRSLGTLLVTSVLGTLYLTIITGYAYIFRLLSRDIVQKFSHDQNIKSSFIQVNQQTAREDFEKLW